MKDNSGNGQDAFNFSLQASILQAFAIIGPKRIKGPILYKDAPTEGEKPLWEATALLRDGIRHMMGNAYGKVPVPTQSWIRSALFLGVAARNGKGGYDLLKDAVWAYTAAMIEGIGNLCNNPDIFRNIPEGNRFSAYMAVVQALRQGLNEQVRLLSDIKDAKARYEKSEPVLEFGRLLLKAVHASDEDDSGEGWQGIAKAIGQYGPGAIPQTDWDGAVMIAKAILYYEAKRKMADNAPETPVSGDQ